MLAILPDRFWLWINAKAKVLPHPFNEAQDGAMNLNYSPWEYKYAESKHGWLSYEPFVGDLKAFVKDKAIADLACGGGGKSIYLVHLGAKALKGCDFSANFIEQAKAFAQEKGVAEKCEFIVADGENTPYQNEEFDIVLLSSVMEHTPSPRAMLQEVLRILKPGGTILFNTEGYYHWLGHHLWDTLPIPWLHLFTSEKQRIRLYRKATKKFKDHEARVNFRVSKNAKGVEEIGYLNHLTLRHLEKLLHKLEHAKKIEIVTYRVNSFRNKLFKFLGKLPILREIFHESVVGVLRKV